MRVAVVQAEVAPTLALGLEHTSALASEAAAGAPSLATCYNRCGWC